MKHPLFVLALTAATLSARDRDEKKLLPGFRYEEIHSGNGMTALDFDSAGRMFVCEKQGRVLVFEPLKNGGYKAPGVFADFHDKVNPDGESGLLGIALDPQFAKSHYLYVFYTAATEQRLVRLTADADFKAALPDKDLVLLDGLPRTATNHKAGDIHFHPADPKAIYLVLGDDTKRELSADLDHFNGKLLRLDASNGKGLADNPFYDGSTDSVKSRVWACGFRNPYRFAFAPGRPPEFVYVSENGDGTDRIAQVKRGANAGWGRHGDKGLIDPADKNVHVLFTTKPCLTSIAIAPKGPFAPDGPVLYAQNWFMREIRRWKLEEPALSSMSAIPADQGVPFLGEHMTVHTAFGPDGALYLTQTYYSASTGNNHKLSRITAEAAARK
ncbi:MAG: PQQ-dependent sugar dehydrogenase [Verrucomicrobiota bacterium]